MRNREIKYPLFLCLKPEAQLALAQMQWDIYGLVIKEALMPEEPIIDTEIESLEEIDHIMRKPPRHHRGDA